MLPKPLTLPPRVVAVAFLVALGGGCASGPTRVGAPTAGGVRLERGVQLGWASKRIVAKEPPHTLVAADGTVCRVAPERYARTEPRAVVACEWQPGAPPAAP